MGIQGPDTHFFIDLTDLGHSSTMNDKVTPPLKMFCLSHFISLVLHNFTDFAEL